MLNSLDSSLDLHGYGQLLLSKHQFSAKTQLRGSENTETLCLQNHEIHKLSYSPLSLEVDIVDAYSCPSVEVPGDQWKFHRRLGSFFAGH